MKAARRTLVGCLVAPLILCVVLFFGWPIYDAATKRALLRDVDRELPAGATMAQMDAFMRRHTEMYDFTRGEPYGLPDDEFGGRLPQTWTDQMLLSRMVLIHLKVDPRTKKFRTADVEIAYTFL